MKNLENENQYEMQPGDVGDVPDYNVAVILDGLREPGDRCYSDPVVSEHKRRMDCFETVRAQFLERVRQEARQEVERELGLPTYWRSGDKQKYLNDWHQKMARLAKADAAPRCEHVFQDGTQCGSPRMKTGRLCYAHERMAQVRPQKLNLLAMEDANSIMLNIMEINRALVDDEITEKRARILLYSQQLGLQALGKLTFHTAQKEQMVRELMGLGDRVIARDRVIGKPEDLTAENAESAEQEQEFATDPRQVGTEERRRAQIGEEESTAKDAKNAKEREDSTTKDTKNAQEAEAEVTGSAGIDSDHRISQSPDHNDAPVPYPSQDLNELAGDIPATSVAASVGAATKREAANSAGIALG